MKDFFSRICFIDEVEMKTEIETKVYKWKNMFSFWAICENPA